MNYIPLKRKGHTKIILDESEDCGRIKIIRYYNTPIVTFDVSHITLNHGGFMTVTTKQRMNQALAEENVHIKVFQLRHEWCVKNTRTRYHQIFGNSTTPNIHIIERRDL